MKAARLPRGSETWDWFMSRYRAWNDAFPHIESYPLTEEEDRVAAAKARIFIDLETGRAEVIELRERRKEILEELGRASADRQKGPMGRADSSQTNVSGPRTWKPTGALRAILRRFNP